MFTALLPEGFVASEAWGDVAAPLYAVEQEAVRGAVAARRAEFATGRHCARAALRALGVPAGPLPVGTDRAPVWPAGVLGSLTHCVGYRAAAVGRAGGVVQALGIDAEPNGPLPEDVRDLVLTPGEADGGSRVGMAWRDRLVFSAKESLFKAWWSHERRWLDFGDARVVPREDGSLDFTLLVAPRLAFRYEGRWGEWDGFVHTVVTARSA